MFAVFLFLFAILQISIQASPLKDRIEKARNGDYLVAEGGKMVTVLSIRSVTPESIVLEEISAPTHNLKQRPASWLDWIKARAPGHTSWAMVEIDRSSGEIIECYSFTRAAWIQMSSQESLLATLLNAPLKPVAEENRRRIGPHP